MRPRDCFCVRSFPAQVIFQLQQQKFVIRTFLCTDQWLSRSLYIHVQCIPDTHGREMMLVRQDLHFSSTSSTWDSDSAFFDTFLCLPRFPTRISLVFDEHMDIPNRYFSHPSPNRTFTNCLPDHNPASGWLYRFRSRGTTGSSMFDQDCGHLRRGSRIHMSGHSDCGLSNIFGASFIFIEYELIPRRPLVLHNLAALQWHPLLLRPVIWDADEPSFVNTA